MWGGNHVALDLTDFTRTEDLLGISTYLNYENFDMDDEESFETDELEHHCDKVKFVGDNSILWTNIDVWKKAVEYFNWEQTFSVKYVGYLMNHTKKLAVDLENYLMQSCYLIQDDDAKVVITAIDAIPVLTETGGGALMAFDNGISIDTTETLAGTWCGDLLQIVDTLHEGYKVINCCFAEVWSKVKHCYYIYGIDEENYVLNVKGKRFEAVKLDCFNRERGPSSFIKVELRKKKIKYIPVRVEESNRANTSSGRRKNNPSPNMMANYIKLEG